MKRSSTLTPEATAAAKSATSEHPTDDAARELLSAIDVVLAKVAKVPHRIELPVLEPGTREAAAAMKEDAWQLQRRINAARSADALPNIASRRRALDDAAASLRDAEVEELTRLARFKELRESRAAHKAAVERFSDQLIGAKQFAIDGPDLAFEALRTEGLGGRARQLFSEVGLSKLLIELLPRAITQAEGAIALLEGELDGFISHPPGGMPAAAGTHPSIPTP